MLFFPDRQYSIVLNSRWVLFASVQLQTWRSIHGTQFSALFLDLMKTAVFDEGGTTCTRVIMTTSYFVLCSVINTKCGMYVIATP